MKNKIFLLTSAIFINFVNQCYTTVNIRFYSNKIIFPVYRLHNIISLLRVFHKILYIWIYNKLRIKHLVRHHIERNDKCFVWSNFGLKSAL
jgi:hypothetical protein